jgi:ribosomal protein L37AE/L43A
VYRRSSLRFAIAFRQACAYAARTTLSRTLLVSDPAAATGRVLLETRSASIARSQHARSRDCTYPPPTSSGRYFANAFDVRSRNAGSVSGLVPACTMLTVSPCSLRSRRASMLQVNRTAAFRPRRAVECPNCGSEEIEAESCGRNVCTDCGIFVAGGSNISTAPPCTAGNEFTAVLPSDPVARSSPIRRIREWHPACERAATNFARDLTAEYVKGMSKGDRVRHTQALAYLAYRDDGQTTVTIARLAAQVRVPEERLSKDVKAIADRLGIRGWQADNDEEDDDVFARAMLTILKPGFLMRGHKVPLINRWCRNLFARSVRSGEVELANLSPVHQANAAAAVYCECVGSPFAEGVFGPPKRGRDGRLEGSAATAVRALTRNATAKRAADSLRKHV